ncbi:Uncharacterised protein [Streptococcus gallolyticus]|uniref:Uncharacterized protein n=1 Tax=Streptococcus gallolyticus TaxID=315405 RepID=A0AA94M4Z7_9STRE|nr:hypothetical protein [Streptococcus gallolyticus]AQP43172.1 hypothetical protein BTR42_11025 [Streptococcus gallolyticus subsp. gallolyticus DSM 16831]MCY7192279.1 hypothetical protein [Streptococcus gallolyticus subsp. gallolyticus]MDO4964480.1 hypothetical protein [Streptococcus gallolyticus]SQG80470.1 Uncharacterised protein [Streptococcus gallolyticus]
MSKISLNEKKWKKVVSSAASSIDSIQKIKIISIEKTTLSRFQHIEELEHKLNTTLANFKKYSAENAEKMNKVADKIVKEDNKAADQIKKNTVRFK